MAGAWVFAVWRTSHSVSGKPPPPPSRGCTRSRLERETDSLLSSYAVGLWVFARMSDRTIVRLTKENDGVFEPEMRLVGTLWFAIVVPVTFFWYGWSTQYRVNSIVPIIGLFPFGFAIIGIWQAAQAYLIDAYGQAYAASALAAFSVLRSVVAAFLPLAGPSMYANLGLGWGNSLLGFICIAMIPVPVFIQRYGGYMRKKYPLKL